MYPSRSLIPHSLPRWHKHMCKIVRLTAWLTVQENILMPDMRCVLASAVRHFVHIECLNLRLTQFFSDAIIGDRHGFLLQIKNKRHFVGWGMLGRSLKALQRDVRKWRWLQLFLLQSLPEVIPVGRKHLKTKAHEGDLLGFEEGMCHHFFKCHSSLPLFTKQFLQYALRLLWHSFRIKWFAVQNFGFNLLCRFSPCIEWILEDESVKS